MAEDKEGARGFDMETLLWILKEVFGFKLDVHSMGNLILRAVGIYNQIKSGRKLTDEEVEEFNKLKLAARAALRMQGEEL